MESNFVNCTNTGNFRNRGRYCVSFDSRSGQCLYCKQCLLFLTQVQSFLFFGIKTNL
jgi:hypothetical protein